MMLMRSGSRYGRGRNRTPLTTLKTASAAPRASPSAVTAAAAKTRGGEAVVLGVAPALRGVPVCRDPAAILEALERWIERPRIDRQDTLGDLSDAVGDPPAVHRRERQCLEHEHVERALDDVAAAILWRHGFLSIIERYDSYLSIVKRWASVGFADPGFGSDHWLDGTCRAGLQSALTVARRPCALRFQPAV